ncbi:hypothetical protein [Caballeronia glebae]|uniref:hypothetical protein n=1 Tax=Caballeronia glebae TaxID=1777143 RepID=UPI00118039AC|nr:hypothetical protein [Caballeronia glebae]
MKSKRFIVIWTALTCSILVIQFIPTTSYGEGEGAKGTTPPTVPIDPNEFIKGKGKPVPKDKNGGHVTCDGGKESKTLPIEKRADGSIVRTEVCD